MNREPTPMEAAILECAKAIDRLAEAIGAQAEREEAIAHTLDAIERREQYVEAFRADDRAFQALAEL